jgi:plastocyanin
MRPPARSRHFTSGAARFAVLATLVCAGQLAGAGVAVAATLLVNVRTADGHALPGAVVTVGPLDGQVHHVAPLRAVVDQIDRAFAPDLLIIPVGSTVEFPNSDSVSHQIYSFSPTKRFQLPLYRGKPYPPVHFDQPGVVTLGCNIHDEMLAYLLVTDAPYYGRTDARGTWSVEVPGGHYQISIWHPRLRDEAADLERELTVRDTDRAELTIRLVKSLQAAPLTDRPHSWDY